MEKLLVEKLNISNDRIQLNDNVFDFAPRIEIAGNFGTFEIGHLLFGIEKTLM
jgi:hypothetical protein